MKKESKLYSEQKISTNELQKRLGLSKDTLYKYVRNDVSITKMPMSIVLEMAKIEKIEANELYSKMLSYQILKGRK